MTDTIRKHPRVDVADALRGFAVLAIVLLHSIEHFNFYSFPDATGQPEWLTFADKAIWKGLFFAFGGKAYAIFAMLFGFSFFVQDYNQRQAGADFRLRFCRRLLILFIIGCVDAVFFTGEILVMYSLIGFILPLVCRLSTRVLLWMAAVCLAQPAFIYHIVRCLLDPAYTVPLADTGELWGITYAAQSSASFAEMVRVNLWEGQIVSLAWAWDHGRIFQTAGLFVLGMLIGRQGWFLAKNLHRWGRVLACALVAWFPISGLDEMLSQALEGTALMFPVHALLGSLANLAFMLILVSGVVYGFYRTRRVSAALRLLIPYGRMSMTNYVTQGIIGSMLFYHWGLYLRIGISASLLVGVAIFFVQYVFCRYWTGRHGHGPLEYVWKRLTWL
ncbi:MAG: DUF418 domain-containing protein [Muribaculaceae bacterium]|nr:DUF418 domain-containing protein [Muribaculaceae bacterium]